MPRRSPLYSTFVARRAKWLYFHVVDVMNGVEVDRDCSAATLVGYFRAWTAPPAGGTGSYQVTEEMTKTFDPDPNSGEQGVVDDGETGWFKVRVEFPNDCGQVICEVVIADTTVTRTSGDITTPTGYLEEQIEDEWPAVVLPSTTRT